jgi:hypothetical protein
VRWFFGVESQAPMVFIVLTAFAAGCAIGVLAMVPSWWQHRRVAKRRATPAPLPAATAVAAPPDIVPEHPSRVGL